MIDLSKKYTAQLKEHSGVPMSCQPFVEKRWFKILLIPYLESIQKKDYNCLFRHKLKV